MRKIKNSGYCHIRKDLIEQDLSVPVGNKYLFVKSLVRYKWIGQQFYVMAFKSWKKAYSIDFEF